MERPYRVVVARPGLDGHDREAEALARALRDAGFEVISTGSSQTPEQLAEATMQEDADAVGLPVLADAHLTIPRMVEELTARGLDDVVVFGGGDVPTADLAALKQRGVAEIFTPGASMASITEWLAEALDAREAASDKEG